MEASKVIPSILREEQIAAAMQAHSLRVNLMFGNINTIGSVIAALHRAHKQVFVHVEMIAGLDHDRNAVQFVAESMRADGIISTRGQMIEAAQQLRCRCVQRVFAIDTAAMQTALRTVRKNNPDEVEVMPGLMPSVIRQMKAAVKKPVIAGGLIHTAEDAAQALESGADFVSTGFAPLW